MSKGQAGRKCVCRKDMDMVRNRFLQSIKAVLLCISAAVLLLLPGCTPKENAAAGGAAEEMGLPAESGQVKVTFFDVGKGDAILIETVGHAMLIDSGYDDTAGILLDYMKEQSIDYLDYLLITHFDKDHVGGADRILRKVETETVFQPDYESDSGQYQEYEEAMAESGIAPVSVTETMELSMGGADFLIYPPQQEEYKEEDNDFSLVVSMTCGERRFLFAGDCEKERLKELLAQDEFSLRHDVLKVPHHGRKEKNSEEFLKAVMPAAAVITSSEEKPADEEICRVLEEMQTEIYFTQNGAVTCLCDEKEIWVTQE